MELTRPPRSAWRVARQAGDFAVPAALALLFLAPGSARSEESAAVAAPSPSPAAAKVLRVGTSGDYAPFSFSTSPPSPQSPSPDGADLAGFDIEVARLFTRERGYRLEFVRFRWPDLGKQLAAGAFDVAMGGITMRPERSILGRYSVPVVATHAVALTWKGSGIATLAELDKPGKRVVVNAGGHLEQVAHQTFRRATVLPLADNDAVRMALLDRTSDAVVTDDFEQKVWTAGARGVVDLGPISNDRKAYFLPASAADLEAEFDRWLIAKEQDGTLARLRRAAFGEAEPDHAVTATPIEAFASAVAERQALMPLVWAAKRKAGKPVEDKAQEAVVLDAAVAALEAAATAAGQPAPDPAVGRAVFEQLLVISKDAQQALADRDAKRRPGAVVTRDSGHAAKTAEQEQVATMPVASAPADPEPRDPSAARVYDLGGELRPAITRITEKIARTMLAMEPAMSSRQATRALDEMLTPGGTRGDRIEVLVDTLMVWSSRRPYAKH